MVRSFIAEVSTLQNQEKWDYYYKKAPKERRDKADHIRKKENQWLSLGVWALYDKVKEKYDLPSGGIFNFSHSGAYVMCSAADEKDKNQKIGCDIEQIGQLKLNLAARYFCRSEYEYISGQDGIQAQTEAFYRCWVLKESFMKATRLGTRLSLNAFEISLHTPGNPTLIQQPVDWMESYYYQEYSLSGVPYKMAVCSTSANIAEELEIEEL